MPCGRSARARTLERYRLPERLQLCGRYLVRAVHDQSDQARENMMWAATLAGIAFGNAGVHDAPRHGLRGRRAGGLVLPEGWDEPDGSHGMSVIVNAPAVFRRIGATSPERHLAQRAAGRRRPRRGAWRGGLRRIAEMMKATGMPNGISSATAGRTSRRSPRARSSSKRLLSNAPVPVDRELVSDLFKLAHVLVIRCGGATTSTS